MKNLETIVKKVAKYYGVPALAMCTRGRPTRTVARAKKCYYVLARRYTDYSTPEIAGYVGVHHSTVIKGAQDFIPPRSLEEWLSNH